MKTKKRLKIKIFENKRDFLKGKPANSNQIKEAEEKLGLIFSDDYKEYLSEYGAVSYEGHEITGITNVNRVNVILVTEEQRKNNPSVPANYYVIEETNIDGIVIWQDESGRIFSTIYEGEPQLIYNSLSEYFSKK